MLKNTKSLIVLLLSLLSFTVICFASDDITTINDLIENSTALNNTEVTIQGEVIGEALERGGNVWINVNDSTNAIGIWLKKDDVEQIKYYGDYKHKGDIVKVTGAFYRACSEHGGDFDIHCSNIKILKSGYPLKEKLSPHKITLAFSLIFITGIIATVYIKIRKK